MTNYQIGIEEQANNMLASCDAAKIPTDLEKVVSSCGLNIMTADLNDSLSGALLRDEKIVVVNRNHPPVRKRFTIAHEIGHHVLHGDKKEFIDGIFKREKQPDNQFIETEKEANQFAAALLMPAHDVVREFQKIDISQEDSINELAEKFKVSSDSMKYRLINLGLIIITPQ